MTTREEAVVALGVDNTAIGRGLATARAKFQEFGRDVKKNVSEGLGSIGSAFAGGAIVAGIKSILDKFEALQTASDNLSIGTDFLQGMQFLASQNAIGGTEKFNKAIEQLNVNIGKLKNGDTAITKTFKDWGVTLDDIAGKDTEAVFYLLADRIKAIPDPARQAAAAFDLMGKGGKSMAGFLAQGSAELHNMVDAVDKLDEDKIKALADAQHKIGEIQNTLTVGGGTLIGWITHDLPNWLGRKAGGGTSDEAELRARARQEAKKNFAANMEARGEVDELKKKRAKELQKIYAEIGETGSGDQGKLNKLEREALELEDKLKDKKLDDMERAKLMLDLAKKNVEYNKELSDQEKKISDAKDKQLEKSKALAKARRDELEEYMPSIDELKHSSRFGGEARRISRLEREAKRTLMRGDTKGYAADVDERNRIYDSLADRGIVKHRSSQDKIEQATERSAKALEKIASFIPSKK